MSYPFELTAEELASRLDEMVDVVWGSLQSTFLVLPKGAGYVSYDRFATAYDVLRRNTEAFHRWDINTVLAAFEEDRLTFVVIRAMLGLSPPEWAYLACSESLMISQGDARRIDRLFRREGVRTTPKTTIISHAMLEKAVQLLAQGAPPVTESVVHRFDKVDTREGLVSIRHVANLGLPYSMLLYERFLGRPWASHRDAVSEYVGDPMELAVEEKLVAAGVACRKTKRAEKVPGFAQAPDFVVPDEWRPAVVIEAKIAEDDGTARDKFTRMLRLVTLSRNRVATGQAGFQVAVCIDGRGFGVRREDMRQLLIETEGKVFTYATLDYLIDHTNLAAFRTKP